MKLLPLIYLMMKSCLIFTAAADDQERLERVGTCSTKCSQGLDCRAKPNFFFPPCQTPPDGLNKVFQNISLSTVLSCEERRKCSLRLRIQAWLQLTDSIHGVSICTSSPGLIPNCRVISFKSEGLSGSLVNVENDCAEMSLGQEVHVAVETVPSYCNTKWTGVYTAPGCTNGELQSHVPACITGKLSYRVDSEKKSLTVNVSEIREGHNYNLRLCHAKGFMCVGVGPNRVIKKEDPVKSVTFSYSRLVPCLCIEGWTAVLDARRVQVCPFKQYMDELWTGINYDSMEASLSWQPLCPITARVTLCQIQDDGDCVDLPGSSHNVTRQKVKFIGVESHPLLCMKFSMGAKGWIRCPFAEGRLSAGAVGVSRHPEGVMLASPTPGTFSVALCEVRSAEPPRTCLSQRSQTVTVETQASVKLRTEVLQGKFCLQVKRLNTTYAAAVIHCFDPVPPADPHVPLDMTWIFILVGVLLTVTTLITLLGLHIWLTVYQRTALRSKAGTCPCKKAQGPAGPATKSHTEPQCSPLGDVLVPDSPKSSSHEKVVLLCESPLR